MVQLEDPCKNGWCSMASVARTAGAWSTQGLQAGFLEEVRFQLRVGRRDKSGRTLKPMAWG